MTKIIKTNKNQNHQEWQNITMFLLPSSSTAKLLRYSRCGVSTLDVQYYKAQLNLAGADPVGVGMNKICNYLGISSKSTSLRTVVLVSSQSSL